jgi:hypothetical protein
VLEGFGTGKVRMQALMQVLQTDEPAAGLPQSMFDVLRCGTLKTLHAGLLSEP